MTNFESLVLHFGVLLPEQKNLELKTLGGGGYVCLKNMKHVTIFERSAHRSKAHFYRRLPRYVDMEQSDDFEILWTRLVQKTQENKNCMSGYLLF